MRQSPDRIRQADEEERFGQVWRAIPTDTDVLVTHGPPAGAKNKLSLLSLQSFLLPVTIQQDRPWTTHKLEN